MPTYGENRFPYAGAFYTGLQNVSTVSTIALVTVATGQVCIITQLYLSNAANAVPQTINGPSGYKYSIVNGVTGVVDLPQVVLGPGVYTITFNAIGSSDWSLSGYFLKSNPV